MSKTTQPAPAAGRRFHRTRTRLAGLRATVRRWPVWWPAAACALTGALAGTGYGLLAAPQYSATAYVVVVPADRADPGTALGFAQAYGRVATSGGVLAQAQPDAGVPLATLRARVESATSPDAPMIEISGTAGRAQQAAGFANAVAKALTEDGNKATKSTGVSLVLFAKALPPASPVSPSAPLSAAVGGCAGGLLGALLLLARPRPGGHRDAVAVPAPAAPVPSWASHNGTAGTAAEPSTAEASAGESRPEEARDRKRATRTEATAGRKRESGPQERERVR
ncbi:lipopolysaccharide biosynthesis protein [Streptomyces sp. 549]|uniref:lipopolysaccharide biosynthesis protein n=1 Tax=Streptomyces sp. 549 TaxID=3049076 RepID=UPI0024C2D330|nr:lipopolysaccharide biosynthesis protein [Streptomyces sp. 549]MDK1473569.1 lipopolysaccharide biosynthesis protein [Streptomyces sp. 549]